MDKGVQRREQLLSIAMRRFARDGSRGTSLAQIAQEAGITQAGLLHYFPTKETLLHAVLDARAEQDGYTAAPPTLPVSDLIDSIVQFVRSWPDDPDLIGMFTVLQIENLTPDSPLHERLLERYQGVRAIARESLKLARDNGELREDLDVDAKAVEFVGFLNGLETSWLLDRTIRADEVATQWAEDQLRVLARPQSRPES